MCGIAGVYAYGQAEPGLDAGRLSAMIEPIAHRGPDDEGVYVSPDRRLGLGFRRLAIVDLSPAGNQPMTNEDGTVWIVFNGEIYNHAAHRPALEARGHRYRSRSDTETILHLYEEYGPDCVHHLRGMFALAIWDAPRRRLFLARDRIGIKPLYYTQHAGRFVFGSEIKAVLADPAIPRDVDTEALSHYLTFMVPPAPLTLFAGVRKLPAGHRMLVEANGQVRVESYWDAIVPARAPQSDEAEAEQIRALLAESVRLRMMSDVPVGLFLSGGIDSSTNVALMARCTDQPVNTFSVAFKDYEQYNELPYARRVAQEFGTNHREVVIDHKDALAYLPQLVHSQDEPIADWVCIPLYFVSKLARESGVVVVHVGEGSDELFCGYPGYLRSLHRQETVWPWLRRVPPGLWRAGAGLAHLVAATGLSWARRGAGFLERLEREDGRFWGGAVVFQGRDKDRLLETPFWRATRYADSGTVPLGFDGRLLAAKPTADTLERMIYVELKHRLPELLLMRVDKITMSASLEARVPFLDHVLVEHAMGIPMTAKIRGGQPKALLKRAVRGLIPDEIIDRPKQGFAAPVAEWFRGDLAEWLRDVLRRSSIHRRGFFDERYVATLVDDHVSARRDTSVRLWSLVNLALWYERWIDRS